MPSAMARQPFESIPYERPNLESLLTAARRSRLMLRLAVNQNGAARAIEDFDTALATWRSAAAVAQIRHDQAIDDPFYQQEHAFFDEAGAQVLGFEREIYEAVSKSRHGATLTERFGPMLMQRAENSRLLVSSEVTGLIAEENRLASESLDLLSEAAVLYDGQSLTLDQMAPWLQNPDRDVRREAHAAVSAFFAWRADNLDLRFDHLVQTRTSIARKLGFTSFTELGYRRMERFDYGRAEVESLREAIVHYIVPLTVEIRRLQRRRLGLDHLYHYDLPCLTSQGNPTVKVAPELLARTAGKLFEGMFEQSPSFLHNLERRHFLDLQARSGKSGGGYCQTILDARLPFIFMNASGTYDDISTLMHECGHAYASVASLCERKLSSLHQPALDICELHATALEFLTYPGMDAFFGDEAETYTLLHMTQSLLFLPYACLVDEFQHRVYDEPDLTMDERNAIWRELEQKYQPTVDYETDEHFASGRAWHQKEHIFTSPFYYIDYAIAELCALELWIQSRAKPKQAIENYIRLCKAGGSSTFSDLLQSAKLKSPFALDSIKTIAYQTSAFLDL